jgi:hypothetical protein
MTTATNTSPNVPLPVGDDRGITMSTYASQNPSF